MKSYITSITTDNYLEGVLILNKSLKRVGAKYPLSVLISKGVSHKVEQILEKKGISTIRASQKLIIDKNIKENEISNVKHWDFTFDKLLVFGLVQFEKLVFLDSDLLLLENIDFLFERPHMTATKADTVIKDWDYLNSGTMVIEPNKDILDGLVAKLPTMYKVRKQFGDQDVIQEYYSNWNKENHLALPQKYNIFIYFLEDYVRKHEYSIFGEKSNKSIAIVHFAGKVKPWMWANINNLWYYASRRKWNTLRISLLYIRLLIHVKF